MQRQRIRPGSTKGGYLLPDLDFQASKAVRAGNVVYLTGATGLTLDGDDFVGKGDPVAPAENAMQTVKVLLEEAGAGVEDICKLTTYVTDHSYRAQVYPVLARHLGGVAPCSTGLVIPGLAEPEIDFEIDVFAVIPEDESGGRRRFSPANTKGGPNFADLDFPLNRAVRAGPMVFLQGQTGRTFEEGFVGKGDPAAQAENAMQCVRTLLEEAGARMEDICKVTPYVKERSYRDLVYPVIARHLKGVNPVSTGVVVDRFGHPHVDFEIDVLAVVPDDPSASHQRFRMTNASEGPMFPGLDYGLSRAVRAGQMVYLQGQTGLTFDGGFVGKGDPAAQADNAMRCVKALLEEAGATTADICKITTYVTDRTYRDMVYPVLARHLTGVYPCSTGLVVKGLAEPYIDFEIDVFAVIPE